MTRELHIYDHASGMIALLFVSPNGTVEAFDVEGLNRIGDFASVAEAAAFACGDVEMSRLDSLTSAQSSERPGRAAAHSSTKTKPRRCGVLPSTPDGGGSGLSERLWPLVVPPSATVQRGLQFLLGTRVDGVCGRPELKGHGVDRQFAFFSPARSRSSRRSRQGTRMRSAHPRSAGAGLLSLPAVCPCTAGTRDDPVFLERLPPSNPYASNLSEGQHTTAPWGSSQSHACANILEQISHG